LGLTQSLNVFLPRLAYFLLLFLFAQAAAQSLGLEPVSRAIGSFLGYLPNLVAALLLVIVGSAIGQFVGGLVTGMAREANLDFAKPLGNMISVLILLIAGIMALTQLKLHTEIVRVVTVCLLAGFALAFGLSFGLGSREVTRDLMAGFYARKLFRVGEQLEVRGEKGVLKAITPTQTLLERDGSTISVANSALMEETVRQS
jgi:small-conductance mechanosensitive channel